MKLVTRQRLHLYRTFTAKRYTTSKTPQQKVIVFKAATTGIPSDSKASIDDVEKWPRVVALYWRVYLSNGNLVNAAGSIVQPDQYTIPNEAAAIHGISTETALQTGQPASQVFDKFLADLHTCKYIVSHNLPFDYQISRAELFRQNMQHTFRFITPISLMEVSRNYVGIPNQYSNSNIAYKTPKLEEVYRKLFNKELEHRQDLEYIVEVTAHCFFELFVRGIISPAQITTYREEILRKMFL